MCRVTMHPVAMRWQGPCAVGEDASLGAAQARGRQGSKDAAGAGTMPALKGRLRKGELVQYSAAFGFDVRLDRRTQSFGLVAVEEGGLRAVCLVDEACPCPLGEEAQHSGEGVDRRGWTAGGWTAGGGPQSAAKRRLPEGWLPRGTAQCEEEGGVRDSRFIAVSTTVIESLSGSMKSSALPIATKISSLMRRGMPYLE